MKWAGILKDTCLFYANLPNFQIKLTFDNWYAIMSLIKSVIIFCALLKIDILEKKEECRKMKKILSVVLIAMMLATAVPAQVFAQEESAASQTTSALEDTSSTASEDVSDTTSDIESSRKQKLLLRFPMRLHPRKTTQQFLKQRIPLR